MNMKMKMKNNKTMLALVLVAALALCSVGVVAAAENSNAEDIEYSYLNGDYTVNSSDSNIFIYGTGTGATATVTVPATVTYSGTISFGYYNPNSGVSVATDTITISGASDLKVIFENGIITLNGNYTGDVTLTAGSVAIGTTYSGSVVAGAATFVNDKSSGLVVTLKDGKACMSGEIKEGKVTVTGTAYVDAILENGAYFGIIVGEKGELIIAEDAKVDTMPYSATTFDVKFKLNADAAKDSVGNVTSAIEVKLGNAIVSPSHVVIDGKTVTIMGLPAGTYTFTYKQAIGNVITGTIVVLDNGKYYVDPTYTVDTYSKATATYDAEKKVYTVTVKTNDSKVVAPTWSPATVTALNGVITFTIDASEFTSTAKTVQRALSIVMGDTTIVGNLSITATISTDGVYSDGKYTFALDQSIASQNGTSKATTVYATAAGTVVSTIEGKLTVDGTFNVTKVYTKTKVAGVETEYYKYTDVEIGTNGSIYVNNMMTYQNDGELTSAILSNQMNATMYVSSIITGTNIPVVNYTYYFTTIANALANSAEITVYGLQVIDRDMTLETAVTGEDIDGTEISIVGQLNIGIKADAEKTPAVEGKTAVVVVPEETSITFTGSTVTVTGINAGIAYVMNGQLKFVGLDTDSYDTEVIADVFMTDETYGIYTDVITALGLAVAGDEIDVRDNVVVVDIYTSATVAKDVTLNASNALIIVRPGMTFTIDGKLDAGAIAIMAATKKVTTAGELVLNSTEVTVGTDVLATSTVGGIYVAGTLTFGTSFDNETDDNKFTADVYIAGTKKAPAIINVNGIVYHDAGIHNSGAIIIDGEAFIATSSVGYVTFNVAGTADLSVIDGQELYTVANVTGTLSTSGIIGFCEIAVTGNGVVGPTNETSASNYISVFVKLTVGTEVKDLKNVTNNCKVDVILVDGSSYISGAKTGMVYAIVYGTPAKDAISIQTGNAVSVTTIADSVSTAFMFGEVLYATEYGLDQSAVDNFLYLQPTLKGLTFNGWYDAVQGGRQITSNEGVYIGEFKTLYGMTSVQTFKVTFEHVQNATWTINGQTVDGISIVEYNENGYVVKLTGIGNYEVKNLQIFVNDKAMPDNYEVSENDVITMTGEVVEKNSAGGMDLVTILLIIITIVIIIMAIIIALKLLRS